MNLEKNTVCYLYLLDTLADWEIGYITAELNSGRFLDKNRKVTVVKVGNTLTPVTTMGGMVITPDKDISEIKPGEGDLLVLPGADTWADEKNQRILDIAADAIGKKVIVAAICGATVALAQKGLLNSRKHTSNDKDFLAMFCPAYTGGEYYQNQPAAADENLITASGLAPLEFACEVFKRAGVMRPGTLDAWFRLYKTMEPNCFFELMESLK